MPLEWPLVGFVALVIEPIRCRRCGASLGGAQTLGSDFFGVIISEGGSAREW